MKNDKSGDAESGAVHRANELIIRVHCAHVIREYGPQLETRGRNDVGECNKQRARRRKNAAAKQIGPRRIFGRSE